jgi:hypothetical protein
LGPFITALANDASRTLDDRDIVAIHELEDGGRRLVFLDIKAKIAVVPHPRSTRGDLARFPFNSE